MKKEAEITKTYLFAQLARTDLTAKYRQNIEQTLQFLAEDALQLPQKWRMFRNDLLELLTDFERTHPVEGYQYALQEMEVDGVSSVYVFLKSQSKAEEKRFWLFSVSAYHPSKKRIAFSSMEEKHLLVQTFEETKEMVLSLLSSDAFQRLSQQI